MEDCPRHALGFVGQSYLWPNGYLFGNVDLVTLAGIPRDTARHEGRSGSSLSDGNQSTGRARLAVYRGGRRVSGLAILRGGGLQRKEPLVDCHARHHQLPATLEFSAASGERHQRYSAVPAER